MITEMEQMGKTIQDALSKIAAQFKGKGGATGTTREAKQNLEQLGRELEAKKGQLKGGARHPGAVGPGGNNSMQGMQDFMKAMAGKVMDNVNQTVDKLNKISDETP